MLHLRNMKLIEKNDDKGKKASPILPTDILNYLVDIDGTICEDVPNEEPERMLTAEEFPEMKGKVNKFYEEGHIITFFTSRTEEHRAYTEKWLKEHGFKYHSIIFQKPRGGNYIWIDNHPIRTIHYRGDADIL